MTFLGMMQNSRSKIAKDNTLEKSYQAKALAYLNRYGGLWIKLSASAYQAGGLPDIIGVYKGLFIAIELKRPSKTNHPTELQLAKLELFRQNGAYATYAYNMEELIKVMENVEDYISAV